MKTTLKLTALIIALALLLSACASTPADAGNPNPQSGFAAYFLDVGQGDATFIICDGITMLVDGGTPASSSLIYSFLETRNIGHIDYIINTHPHEDHVGGLSGALNKVSSVGNVYSSRTEHDSRTFESFKRYTEALGKQITVPKPGDTFMLGSATVDILGPVNVYSDINNNSIILKITYGETSFLLTGDAERESETDMVDAGVDLAATVLHVGHHGSDTSTTYPFLREVMPEIAIISCGKDNPYGHPHENPLSRLRDAEVTLYRTDLQGDITVTSDGKNVIVSTEKNADIQTNPTENETDIIEDYYIGNKNTKRIHRPSCSGLPQEHNQVLFDTLQAGLDEGYAPCGSCKP